MSRMVAGIAAALVLLCAASPTGVSGQSAQPPATGAISGVVTDAVTHAPIADALVSLTPSLRRSTDAKGRFVFTDLKPGKYFVRADHDHYADGFFGAGLNPQPIELIADAWFKNADITLVKLGAIGGTVVDERGEPVVGAFVRVLARFTLAGTPQLAAGPAVRTDDRGAYRIANLPHGSYIVTVPSVQHSMPSTASSADVEGLSSEAMANIRNGTSLEHPAVRNGGVIADGLTALILGSYVTPPPPTGGRLQTYPAVFFPSAPTIAGAAPVTIEYGGDRSDVNFVLTPVPAFRVSGRIDGPPPGRLLLRLVSRGLEGLGFGSEAATTVARADGTFTFVNVPAGDYVIDAGSVFEYSLLAPTIVGDGFTENPLGPLPPTPGLMRAASSRSGGYVPATGLASPAASIGTNTFEQSGLAQTGYARVPVSVGNQDVSAAVVPVLRPATLRCRVVFESLSGAAPTGNLQLGAADGSPVLPGRSVTHTGAEWEATAATPAVMSGLLPGAYVFNFLALSGNPGAIAIKSVVVDNVDASRHPIALDQGRDASVTITLTGRAGRMIGFLRDDAGVVVKDASVVIFPVDRSLWANQGLTPTWVRSATSSDRGEYQITGIRAGEYYVLALDATNRPWRDPAFLETASATARTITIEWGESKTLDLRVMRSKK